MKGTKRYAVSDSNLDNDDSALQNKRVTEGSQFDAHRAETSADQSISAPPLDLQRAESSRQHVRGLNIQFASWVQTQLKNHSDELWENGVRDYLTHASEIMEKYSDVVNWLKAKTVKGGNLPAAGLQAFEKKIMPEKNNNNVKTFRAKSGFTPLGATNGFAASWNSGAMSNNQSSKGVLTNNQNYAGGMSNNQSSARALSNNQSSVGALSNNHSSAGELSNNQNSAEVISKSQSSSGVFINGQNSGVLSNNPNSGLFSNGQSSGVFWQSSGQFSNNQSSSQFSNNQSSGHLSNNQSSGQLSNNQSSGQFSNNQSSGQFSNKQSSGQFSNNQSSGQFSNKQSSGQFSNNQSSSILSNTKSCGPFSSTQTSAVFSNTQSSVFDMHSSSSSSKSQSFGLFSNNPAPILFGKQNSVSSNHDASNAEDDENELEQPDSPSVEKSEEKGVDIVHEVKCKLYVKSIDPSDKDTWKDKGTGNLSIKCKEGVSKGTKESKPTIVIRNDAGKLLLNALLYPGIKTNKQKNSVVAIFHISGDGDGNDNVVARTCLIRLKSEEDRNKLATIIQEYAPSA